VVPSNGVKRNLTVQLDEGTIEKAKAIAARRNTSVSRLIADQVEELVERDVAYEAAYAAWRLQMEQPTAKAAGKSRSWKREDLYDRKIMRRREGRDG
jgi:predicted transcriptional regulator